MSKHTPGPWGVRDLPTTQRYIGPSNDGGAPSVALVLARVNVPDERLSADASLVAAAPELLAALESFLRAPSVGSGGPGSITIVVQDFNLRAARAAIAKATGGEA